MNTRQGAPPQLLIDDLHLQFGGVTALNDVSLRLQTGELAAIIGPNGAGKSSLLNTISGLYRPRRGRIQFEGASLVGRKPHQVAQLGIARTFQNLGVFKELTVLDNLLLGRHVHLRAGVLRGGLYWGPARREEAAARLQVEQIIDTLQLQPVRRQPVGTLAYGLQKRVELGRALAQQPRLLLLDEPMAGMNMDEKATLAEVIRGINTQAGISVLMIEHDVGVVMDLAHRIHVLDFGQKIAEGTPHQVQRDARVIRAYLGQEAA